MNPIKNTLTDLSLLVDSTAKPSPDAFFLFPYYVIGKVDESKDYRSYRARFDFSSLEMYSFMVTFSGYD